MAEAQGPENRHPEEVGHEIRDAQVKPIVVFLVVLTGIIVAAFIIMAVLFNILERGQAARDEPPSPLADTRTLPPAPRLDTTSRGELDEIIEAANQKLNRYEWVDRDAGVVQIPIDRAMDLVVERGLPTRDQPARASGR